MVFIRFKIINLVIIDLSNIMWFLNVWYSQKSTLFLIGLVDFCHWAIFYFMGIFLHFILILQITWVEIVNSAISGHRSVGANSFLLSNIFVHAAEATANLVIWLSDSTVFDAFDSRKLLLVTGLWGSYGSDDVLV